MKLENKHLFLSVRKMERNIMVTEHIEKITHLM
jgi:hypothetical protein